MYYLFSIITGILVAVMIVANGAMSNSFGVYSSTAVIHLVGLIFIAIIYVSQKRPKHSGKNIPLYIYSGGIIGVLTIVFNNISFGKISVSAILALGLLGQSITAILIDQFGLFKMPKVAFSKKKIIGLTFVIVGIMIMVTLEEAKEVLAITVALLTGLTIVTARTINARLAQETSTMYSTLLNYIIGFTTSLVILFLAGRNEPMFTGFVIPTNIFIYTGGILGVFTIIILNITVTKISSFYLTLTLFIGQVFSGIVIDIILSSSFSVNNLIGGVLVAVGLSLNVWLDKISEENKDVGLVSCAK